MCIECSWLASALWEGGCSGVWELPSLCRGMGPSWAGQLCFASCFPPEKAALACPWGKEHLPIFPIDFPADSALTFPTILLNSLWSRGTLQPCHQAQCAGTGEAGVPGEAGRREAMGWTEKKVGFFQKLKKEKESRVCQPQFCLFIELRLALPWRAYLGIPLCRSCSFIV